MGVIRRSKSLGLALVNCLHENIALLEKQTVAQDVKKLSILNANPVFIAIQKTTKHSVKSIPILIHLFFRIKFNIMHNISIYNPYSSNQLPLFISTYYQFMCSFHLF
jgi:hypothetical protein